MDRNTPAEQQAMAPTSSTPDNKMYLVLSNISKRPNVRSLLLTAAAFECSGVFLVGLPQFVTSPDGSTDVPSQLRRHVQPDGKMPIVRFDKWNDCVEYLKSQKIFLVGVEIHEEAENIETFPLVHGSVAFVLGNEGTGLSTKHMASCDRFLIISQYGGGTASLNVNVAASIVLHRYNILMRSTAANLTR